MSLPVWITGILLSRVLRERVVPVPSLFCVLFLIIDLAAVSAGLAVWWLPELLVDQEQRCQPEENEEAAAVGDGSEHHAGADCRIAPHLLHGERNQHADHGA